MSSFQPTVRSANLQSTFSMAVILYGQQTTLGGKALKGKLENIGMSKLSCSAPSNTVDGVILKAGCGEERI